MKTGVISTMGGRKGQLWIDMVYRVVKDGLYEVAFILTFPITSTMKIEIQSLSPFRKWCPSWISSLS